jgi:hypothetical protein
MSTHSISSLQHYNMPSQSGGNGVGYGPLFTAPPGNYQVVMGVEGVGSIKLQKADGTVLCSGNGGHRGGLLNFASATTVQFVVTGSDPAGTRSARGNLQLVTNGKSWSE